MPMHDMSPVDAAWYRMDGPANPAVVNALVTTLKPLDLDRVRSVFEKRLLRFDRFRQRVVEPALSPGMPRWEDFEDFDIEDHLHHVAVPAPGDEAALRTLAGELASAPLPAGRPLWQAYVIEGVRLGTGRTAAKGGALFMRHHHCIGDGLAMMTVAAALFDTTPRGRHLPILDALPPPAGPGPFEAAFDAITHPRRLADATLKLADAGLVLVAELFKPADPVSPFKGRFGSRQQVAWSEPVSLDLLKAIGKPFHAKANDVMVAALAGALRSYLEHRGGDLRHDTLRAMVPVNLRPPERALALGNEFGLVILELPIGERDGLQRVAETKARMDALKRSPEPVAMEWLFNLFGRGPKGLQDVAQTLFGSKASVVLTNVAGPREALYLAGAAVRDMMFWVPHPGDELGMGLSLMSYCGQVRLGVMADARLVPDPQAIAAGFNAELAWLQERHAEAAARREALKARLARPRGAGPAKAGAHARTSR